MYMSTVTIYKGKAIRQLFYNSEEILCTISESQESKTLKQCEFLQSSFQLKIKQKKKKKALFKNIFFKQTLLLHKLDEYSAPILNQDYYS